MNDFRDVLAFHVKFELPRGQVPKAMTQDMEDFRIPFLYEEHAEFEKAWMERNLVQAADALFDMAYVAIGTALFIGVPERFVWSYADVIAVDLKQSGVILPRRPQFLPIGMHQFYTAGLRGVIDLFKLAHDAAKNGELNAVEHALDMLRQIVDGCYCAAAMMGIPWELCWRHVQAANMAKKRAAQDGSDSKRRTPWDVVKPEGWSAPDAAIAEELLKAGWQVGKPIDINHRTGKVRLLEVSQ